MVNRIAAGEIIQRPANALKEMMENSLDAGAKMIRIQLRDGGLKMLQIQDDGSGVAPNDLPLLCERFATSKLRSFEDLNSMTTFGFRGEALASISYVSASMNVVSRTAQSQLAYRAAYASGKLVPSKAGHSAAPKPCAGSKGTFITAEDLFYNVPQRRRALKSASEEYNMALEVVSKYAVHYGARGVGFSCKKAGSSMVDLSVPSSTATSTVDVIGMIYGPKVAKDLLHLAPLRNESLRVTLEGWISGPHQSAKKSVFLLFINNRLVDAPALRRSVLALYTTVLPKGAYPWIYLSLHIDEANVDVNVHPTKREVHFLHEEDIVEVICTHMQACLANADSGRNFATSSSQAVLTEFHAGPPPAASTSALRRSGASSDAPGYPQHTVRVDAKARTLDGMGAIVYQQKDRTGHAPDSSSSDRMEVDVDHDHQTALQRFEGTQVWKGESNTTLESVEELRQAVHLNRHTELTEVLRDHTFVGIVDPNKALLLVQNRTKLFLVQYADVIREMAYQLLLRQFGQLSRIQLHPAPYLDDLIRAALQAESPDSHKRRHALGISIEQAVRRTEHILSEKAEMLMEYFAVGIEAEQSSSGRMRLTSLPNLLGGHRSAGSTSASPAHVVLMLERVPSLMLRLATQVDYGQEKACFESILRELALAHVPWMPESANDHIDDKDNDGECKPLRSTHKEEQKRLEAKRDWIAVWTPAMRLFTPSRSLAKRGAVTSVASLPSLYSVFERC